MYRRKRITATRMLGVVRSLWPAAIVRWRRCIIKSTLLIGRKRTVHGSIFTHRARDLNVA